MSFVATSIACLLSSLPPKLPLLGPLNELLRRHSVHCLDKKSLHPAFLGSFGHAFCPILQSLTTVCSVALHWISENERGLQTVRMAMNLAGVGINGVIPEANVLVEESKKLACPPVKHLWFASCFKRQVLGAAQTRVKTPSKLCKLDMRFHLAKNRQCDAGPLVRGLTRKRFLSLCFLQDKGMRAGL